MCIYTLLLISFYHTLQSCKKQVLKIKGAVVWKCWTKKFCSQSQNQTDTCCIYFCFVLSTTKMFRIIKFICSWATPTQNKCKASARAAQRLCNIWQTRYKTLIVFSVKYYNNSVCWLWWPVHDHEQFQHPFQVSDACFQNEIAGHILEFFLGNGNGDKTGRQSTQKLFLQLLYVPRTMCPNRFRCPNIMLGDQWYWFQITASKNIHWFFFNNYWNAFIARFVCNLKQYFIMKFWNPPHKFTCMLILAEIWHL